MISTRSLIDWDGSETLGRDNDAIRILMDEPLNEAQRRSLLRSSNIADTKLAGRALVYGLARMCIDGHFAQWASDGDSAERTTHAVLGHFVALLEKEEPTAT